MQRLKDLYKGERCFVIGNGPNLKSQDLSKLINEYVIVANSFPLHPVFPQLKHAFYCLVDTETMFQNGKECESLYNLLKDSINMPKFFVDRGIRGKIEEDKLFKGHSIYYVTHSSGAGSILSKKEVELDITRLVRAGGTVVIDICLPVAYYLGFRTIYLLGCDCTPVGHFYDDEIVNADEDWVDTMIKSYRLIKVAFELNNRKIYNATPNSQLKEFQRVEYESLFEG